jgi:hypothetical protein
MEQGSTSSRFYDDRRYSLDILEIGLLRTTMSQVAPDTLFSGPKSVPGSSVPLCDPVLVPGPDKEGAAPSEEEEQCVAIDPR